MNRIGQRVQSIREIWQASEPSRLELDHPTCLKAETTGWLGNVITNIPSTGGWIRLSLYWLAEPCTPLHCLAPASFEIRMPPTSTSVMTLREVADYLRVNQRTVYRLAAERKMPSFKVGAKWRFKRSDIDLWIAEQSGIATTPGELLHAERKQAR